MNRKRRRVEAKKLQRPKTLLEAMMMMAWVREVKLRTTKVKSWMVTALEIAVMATVMTLATAWGAELGVHPLLAFLVGTATVIVGMGIRAQRK